jgi:putative addiction module component (TIGR02574 family)
MSKSEIIAELPHLSPEDRAEVQAKLDELSGDVWHPQADLTEADKSTLDAALKDYEKNPNAGSSWNEVKARIQSKLRS